MVGMNPGEPVMKPGKKESGTELEIKEVELD